MPRLFRKLIVLLLVLPAVAYLYGRQRNPEKRTLDDAARAEAPGKFVSLPVGRTHYLVSGPDTGRVVVLVHGFSVPSYIWDSTAVALSAAGMRVIRYDVYGRGWSDRPDADYDGTLYDAQLDGLLDSLHIAGPVDLMGLSFGGYVTAHYVASHPARVRTLTLVDPVAVGRTVPAYMHWPVVGEWLFQTTQVPGMADGQSGDFLHPERFPDWPDRYRSQMQFKGFGRALLRSIYTSERTNFDSLYAAAGRTGVPTLLVWGRQDPVVPFDKSSVILGGIPKTTFVPVDSSGHLPHMEQAPIVARAMLEFLSAHPRTP
jgi:pimeloyl-ACP methyl ester carboxylesterase